MRLGGHAHPHRGVAVPGFGATPVDALRDALRRAWRLDPVRVVEGALTRWPAAEIPDLVSAELSVPRPDVVSALQVALAGECA